MIVKEAVKHKGEAFKRRRDCLGLELEAFAARVNLRTDVYQRFESTGEGLSEVVLAMVEARTREMEKKLEADIRETISAFGWRSR